MESTVAKWILDEYLNSELFQYRKNILILRTSNVMSSDRNCCSEGKSREWNVRVEDKDKIRLQIQVMKVFSFSYHRRIKKAAL